MQTNTDRDDNGMGSFYVVSIILLIVLALYWYFHDALVNLDFMIKRFELAIIMSWDDRYTLLMSWCNHVIKSHVTLKQLEYLSYSVSRGLITVFWVAGGVMMLLLYITHPSLKYRRNFNMPKLLAQMKTRFSKVFVYGKAEKTLQSALSPNEFLMKSGIITHDGVDKARLTVLLNTQLGMPWCGVDVLEYDVYVLVVTFSMYILEKRRAADDLLGILNLYYLSRNIICRFILRSRIDKVIKLNISDTLMDSKIRNILQAHYFQNTVLCELLYEARKDGIIPSSSFLWLKRVNRSLWYGLNNVGRKTFFSEGVSIAVHWQAEKSAKMAIQAPMTQNAMNTFCLLYEQFKELKSDRV